MTKSTQRILLIGIDGIGLDDVKHYGLKNIEQVFRKGAHGRLNISPLNNAAYAWTSLVTGCSADLHGIYGSAMADGSAVRATAPDDWHQPAFWELIDENDLLTHRFNLPARHPEPKQERSLSISPLFFSQLKAGTLATDRSVVPDNFSNAAKALAVLPENVDSATLSLFVPDIGKPGDSALSDFGILRGSIAASLSQQAIAGQAMAELDWNCMAIRFSLAEDLKSMDAGNERFTHVQEAAFRTLNLCIGTLRRLAGNHTLVLFSSRGNGGGFVAFEGAGIKARESLLGAKPADIAPTILHLIGYAPPTHMNGRVLNEMFSTPLSTEPLPAAKRPAKSGLPSLEESQELLDEADCNMPAWRIEALANELKVTAHLHQGNWFESLPHLLELLAGAPFSLNYALQLCHALFHSGLVSESIDLMRRTANLHATAEISPLLNALAVYHSGNREEACDQLEGFGAGSALPADWQLFLTEAYLQLGYTDRAFEQLESLLTQYPEHALALTTKAELLLNRGRSIEACAAALHAVELNFSSERAHLVLARALLLQDRKDEARAAVVTAMKLKPDSPAGLRVLAECIDQEDAWGAEMMRARATATDPEKAIESRRWQYQLFEEDILRKFGSSTIRRLNKNEIANLAMPESALEQIEALACMKTRKQALLCKPLTKNEPAQVEFLEEPSFALIQGITDRCRKLGISHIRTWSLHQTGTPLFETLEACGFKPWIDNAHLNVRTTLQGLELQMA